MEGYYDVFVVVPGDEIAYALEFSGFRKWAGLGVDQASLAEFGPAKVAAAFLCEMTLRN